MKHGWRVPQSALVLGEQRSLSRCTRTCATRLCPTAGLARANRSTIRHRLQRPLPLLPVSLWACRIAGGFGHQRRWDVSDALDAVSGFSRNSLLGCGETYAVRDLCASRAPALCALTSLSLCHLAYRGGSAFCLRVSRYQALCHRSQRQTAGAAGELGEYAGRSDLAVRSAFSLGVGSALCFCH
jgi:hypothetical protein